MWISRRYGWIQVLGALVLGTGGLPRLAAAEGEALPAPVRDALARYAELKTFSVTWTQQFRLSASARAKLGLADAQDSPSSTCYLVWQGGKMYSRRNEGGREWKDAPGTSRNEFAFDGRIIAGGRPGESSAARPNLVISSAEDGDGDAEYFGVDYFQSMGIRLPRGLGELRQSKHLASQVLFLLEHGGQVKTVGTAQIDGRPMTRVEMLVDNSMWSVAQKEDLAALERVLRNTRIYTAAQIQQKLASAKQRKETTPRRLVYVFYLDPAFGYAVRRWQEMTDDGRLRVQSDCTRHKKLPGYEIWLPGMCRTDSYISGNLPGEYFDSPFQTDALEVSEYGTQAVPEKQFSLNYTTPGTDVTDNTLPEAQSGKRGVSYQIPANPEDLDRVVAQARASTLRLAELEKQRYIIKMVLLVVNAVGLVALSAYLVIRHRRRIAKS
jgi:hypothetical protein